MGIYNWIKNKFTRRVQVFDVTQFVNIMKIASKTHTQAEVVSIYLSNIEITERDIEIATIAFK